MMTSYYARVEGYVHGRDVSTCKIVRYKTMILKNEKKCDNASRASNMRLLGELNGTGTESKVALDAWPSHFTTPGLSAHPAKPGCTAFK